MSEESALLSVCLSLPADTTPEEKEEALSQLRRELLETDVKSVERVAGPVAPAGAKGLPPGLDTLLVKLAGSLGGVVSAIASWSSGRRGSVSIKVDGNEFTFTNPSADDMHELVTACVARLSGDKG